MWIIPSTNPEGRAFITVLIVFLIIAVLIFGLRVYSRRLNKAPLDASDYFCSVNLVSIVKLATNSHFLVNVLKVFDVGIVVMVWGCKAPHTRNNSHLALADKIRSILAWLG
jgi:uncharacterized membrane protein YhaH (DUF805 family)